MTKQQIVKLINSGTRVVLNSSYFPVGIDSFGELYVVCKYKNTTEILSSSDISRCFVRMD